MNQNEMYPRKYVKSRDRVIK